MCAGAIINARIRWWCLGRMTPKPVPVVRWWICFRCGIITNPKPWEAFYRKHALPNCSSFSGGYGPNEKNPEKKASRFRKRSGSLFSTIFALCVENIPVQPVHGLLDQTVRQSQVQADAIRTVERTAVLPDDAYPHAGAQELVQRLSVGVAPLFAV